MVQTFLLVACYNHIAFFPTFLWYKNLFSNLSYRHFFSHNNLKRHKHLLLLWVYISRNGLFQSFHIRMFAKLHHVAQENSAA